MHALEWYRKAADLGSPQAQFSIGYLFANGLWVSRNAEEAMKWYQKASDKGYAPAQFNLALFYANGEGVPKDTSNAQGLMQKAAAGGMAEAQKWLEMHKASAPVRTARAPQPRRSRQPPNTEPVGGSVTLSPPASASAPVQQHRDCFTFNRQQVCQ